MSRIRVISWAALLLAAAAVVYLIASSGKSGYTVYAEFHDVDGLRDGSTVKVAGVPAGLVTNLTVTPSGNAMATLTLDPGAAPIGQGASVEVRPTDLLGEHYAQLNVGNLNRPMPSGSFIPMSRTSVPVDLDQVLNTLNVGVRTRLRILINEAGIALDGRGANFNELLNDLPPDLTQAQELLGQVASENATLSSLIDQGNQVTSAVYFKRDDMGRFLQTGEQALHSVALRQQQLAQTIGSAPAALSQLRSTLAQLQTASAAIIPAANELRSTSGPLAGTLRQLPPLAASADPTLIEARTVAPTLERLGREGLAPIEALRPAAGAVNSVAAAATPVIGELNQRAMRDILWFIENWALATKSRDTLGHFVGADLEIDPTIVDSAVASFIHDSSSPTGSLRRHGNPSKGSLGGTLNSLGGTVSNTTGGLTSGITKGVSGLLNGTTQGLGKTLTGAGSSVSSLLGGGGSSSSTASSSTGSTQGMQNLLNYLLGK